MMSVAMKSGAIAPISWEAEAGDAVKIKNAIAKIWMVCLNILKSPCYPSMIAFFTIEGVNNWGRIISSGRFPLC